MWTIRILILVVSLESLCLGLPNLAAEELDSRPEEPVRHTFSFEHVSPQQKIITGCEGAKFVSGNSNIQYYVVDATGQRKSVSPEEPLDLLLPSPNGIAPGFMRTQTFFMHELCFPEDCGAGPCDSVVRAPVWSFPKFPWFPSWRNNGHGIGFNANSQAHAHVLSSLTGTSIGASTNVGASVSLDEGPPTDIPSSSKASSKSQSKEVSKSQASAASKSPATAGSKGQSKEVSKSQATVGSKSQANATSKIQASPVSKNQQVTAKAQQTVSDSKSPQNSPVVTNSSNSNLSLPTTSTSARDPPSDSNSSSSTSSFYSSAGSTTCGTSTITTTTTTTPTCGCCDHCPAYKALEKLMLSKLESPTVNPNPWPAPTNNFYWTQPLVNPIQPDSNWPFPQRSTQSKQRNIQEHSRDPSFYAALPGAIRGQAPVIYYPSCDPDAFYQPAIINYCTDYSESPSGASNLRPSDKVQQTLVVP